MSSEETKRVEIRKRRRLYHDHWNEICTNLYVSLCAAARHLLHKHTYRGFTYTGEDLANATIAKILHYCPDPSGIKDERAYILRTLRVICYDLLHKELEMKLLSVEDDEPDEGPAAELRDLRSDFKQAIEKDELINIIKNDPGPLTERETKLFQLFLRDRSLAEIAELMGEDVRITRYDLNKVRDKVIFRFKKQGFHWSDLQKGRTVNWASVEHNEPSEPPAAELRDLKHEKWALSEAELQEQIKRAVKTGERELDTEPRAERAEYNRKSDIIWVYLNNKSVFGFSPSFIKELAGATSDEISKVNVNPLGDALHWDDLDAHYTIAGLLGGIFGTRQWMQELGRKGGRTPSRAKSEAARKNGAKGGRPKKA